MTGQASAAEVDRMILEAATGARRLTHPELRRVLEHVARVGFDPNAREKARGRLTGIIWQGRALQGSDVLPPAEAHYLRHVVWRQEWPGSISLDQYVESIRAVILDRRSGIFTSQYQGTRQLGIARRADDLQGPQGMD
jgi:hypothetical protein